jgi:Tol biopolymer transport system component
MGTDGSGAKPVSAGPQDHHPAWSPSGKLLLFARSTTSNIDLFTVRAEGTGEVQLTNTPGLDFQGAWSPDGKRIVFSSDRESTTRGLMHLFAMAANGTGAKRLLNGDAADLEGDWQALAAPTASQALAAVRSYLAAHAKACKLVIGKLTAKSSAGGFRVTASLKKAGKPATATFDVSGKTVKPVNATAKLIAKNCR